MAKVKVGDLSTIFRKKADKIQTADIVDNAITTAKILNGTILTEDLSSTVIKRITDLETKLDLASHAADLALLRYNEETGRYDGVGDWLNYRRDGLIYGIKIPKYSFSNAVTATKTGANAGLVLEASTETHAGRNDYQGKALFECIRCNGGVETDGMPYVTAIEGYDDKFDPKENTFTITPVYYRRIVSDTQYDTFEYTDTPQTGFTPCFGAYTSDNKLRPYILRACYMDSDGKCSTKSGTLPATPRVGSVSHSTSWDFTNSKNRNDGLTYKTYGDFCYQLDFMELMLGVKAPRSQVIGCAAYNYQPALALAETNVKRIVLTDANANNIVVGSRLSIGDGTVTNKDRNNANMHNIANSAKVLSKQSLGNGTTAINLDLSTNITTKTEYVASTMPWANGTCDKVLGTYGTRTTEALKNSKEPYRFQNIEFNLGIWECLCDMMTTATVDTSSVTHHKLFIAPDVSKCTAADGGTGWTQLTHTLDGASGVKYIKDYTVEKGARVPAVVGGTASTGYMVGCWDYGSAGTHEILVGGHLSNGAYAGAGTFSAYDALALTSWYFGGRPSAIGHSAPVN